jgi:hypothetical protein
MLETYAYHSMVFYIDLVTTMCVHHLNELVTCKIYFMNYIEDVSIWCNCQMI